MNIKYNSLKEIIGEVALSNKDGDVDFLTKNIFLRKKVLDDNEVDFALRIGATVHRHDFYGHKPYLYHLVEVFNGVKTKEAQILSFLHDALEDHPEDTSLNFIEGAFGMPIRKALIAISRKKDEPIFNYLERVKSDRIATEVKISDASTNLYHSSRERNMRIIKKYTKTLSHLVL